jgi:hypothetical protein
MECSRQSYAYTVTRLKSLEKPLIANRVERNCNQCGKSFNSTNRSLESGKKKGTGKFCSLRCMWDARPKKEAHHNWKGGPKDELEFIRQCDEMKDWRKFVLERGRFTCGICGQVGGRIQTHHMLPFFCFPEHRLDKNNGISLCKSCHYKQPKGRGVKSAFSLFYWANVTKFMGKDAL